jgi:hypothetical protein
MSSVKKYYRKAKLRILNQKGNVLKGASKKMIDKSAATFAEQPPNFKKVTTRFGRSINVKMAQY